MSTDHDITIIFKKIERPTSFLDELFDYLSEIESVDFREREVNCTVSDENLDSVRSMEEIEEVSFF